ncbi:Fc receptor-like protein 5 [Halichoeres trimaculatus]|uniref:Fc receptor-like protein 5 n=1 Tax=Halichoeres trimaculatus TaxID=147232 RepID=UPI003D9EF865
MARTLFCVVVFFMLNAPFHCRHTGENPRPVLTVSSPWLNPEASVTLTCRVEDPDAEFDWYRAFPRPTSNYRQEPLTCDSSGTEQNSCVVYGQKQTTAYVCRAKRDNAQNSPVVSKPKFVWSRDSDQASIKVSPDRVNHSTSDSVTLSCEGSSAQWRVMRLTEADHLSNCSGWGTMTGSTCRINKFTKKTAVYWCESGSGQFSNAVNITWQTELKSESSSSNLSLIIGLTFGLLTIIVLLLLCYYKKFKKRRLARLTKTQGTNQDSVAYEVVNHSGNQPCTKSPHLNDRGDSNEVVYSLLELKNMRSQGNLCPGEQEPTVYSQVNPGTHRDLYPLFVVVTETLLKSGQSEAAQVNATLRADNTTIPAGGAVVLTCSVESVNNPSGWKYQWFRRTNGSTQAISVSNSNTSVTRGGDYWCKARRTDSSAFTANSNVVPIYELVSSRPVVTLEPSGTQIFGGETKTLRCEIHGGEDIKWEYEWMAPNSGISSNSKEYKMGKVVASDGSDYRCRGIRRGDIYSSTEWSETVTLTFYPTARAKISADKKDIPAGGSVTLTCSVIPPSPGWEYSWFRGRKIPEPLNPQDAVVLSSHQISVWKGGPYWCRARRGNPVYYTENTDYISLNQYIAKKAVSTIQPKWPRIYKEELITFSCDIEDEDYSEWDFEWRGRGSYRPPRQQKVLTHAYAFYNGQYTCVGKRKNEPTTMTAWSEPVSLTVYDYIPKPILAVTPSWLSPGDPVTLHCDIKYPSAGWRFYWYKAVPKLQKSYSYELLPDSNSGTASNSYVVHGQTHTAGYACRAGRGDPIYYTRYSDVKFVWSGDVQSASLTVSTNRVQHFTSDSVTLSCQGSSAQWRVKVVEEEISKLDDPDCKAMTGATCTISRVQEGSSVYWCESDAGEFSNAVNISADSM